MKKIKPALFFLLFTVVGGLIGYSAGKLGLLAFVENFSGLHLLVWLLVGLPLGWLLAILAHELGHVVAGLAQGFTFYGLTVGPLAWERKQGRVRFRWNRNINLSGGLALMLPRGQERLRARFLTFVAGGPLASVVFAALLFWLAAQVAPGQWLQLLLGGTALLSAVIGVSTLIPLQSGGFSSDGLRLLTLSRNNERARTEVTLLELMAQLRSGSSLEELPVGRIERAMELPSTPPVYRLSFAYYLYLYYAYREAYPRADELLRSVMAGLDCYPAGLRGAFYLEEAIFSALYRDDLPAAEAAYARYQPATFIQAIDSKMAEAALARARGDAARVGQLLTEMEAELPHVMYRATLPLYRQRLAHLLREVSPWPAAGERAFD